jgi:hypothetical protein
MKYVKTFEAYQKYSDYQKGRMTWGTPEDLKQDAILTLKRALPTFDEKWIDQTEDQSDDAKGIKFQFKVGKDLIHLYKVDSWRGGWEFYLNKKRSDVNQVKDHLEKTHMSALDVFLKNASSFDYYAEYIDNGGQYQAAQANNSAVLKMWAELNTSDRNKARKELYKKGNRERVDLYFK